MSVNKNPFLEKCEDCVEDIWEILQNELKEEENPYTSTVVKIEKFEGDNIS